MALKLPKILPREDVAKILAVPNISTTLGLRNRTILQVMYRAGLRVQEVCNLTIEDVNLNDGFIYVQAGKGDKDRYIPMDSDTVSWCEKWNVVREKWAADKGRKLGDQLFCSLKGTELDQRYIRSMLYKICKAAGVYIRSGKVKKLPSPHNLRHCCLTELLEDGLDLHEVQAVAGHASIETTSIYLAVRPHVLAEKMRNRAAPL